MSNKNFTIVENIKELRITKTMYVVEVTYKEYLDFRYPKINTSILPKELGDKQGFMTFVKIGDSFVPYGWFSETIEGLRGYK